MAGSVFAFEELTVSTVALNLTAATYEPDAAHDMEVRGADIKCHL